MAEKEAARNAEKKFFNFENGYLSYIYIFFYHKIIATESSYPILTSNRFIGLINKFLHMI